MTLFDVILLVLLGGFVMFGAWFGFFHALGALLGAVIGSVIASWLHIPLAAWADSVFGGGQWTYTITFMIIFMIIGRLVGFGFYILEKTFSIVTRLPFLSDVDRILGAIIGFFEGVLVIGMILYVSSRYNLGNTLLDAIAASTVAPWFVNSSSLLQPLFPQALKELRSVIGI